jgi:glycine dehydrogenase subunit 1
LSQLPIPDEHRDAMLAAVGVSSVEDLFADIPAGVRLQRELELPAGLSEMGLTARLEDLARRDAGASTLVSFMGAGCYDSFVPAIVDSTVSRPEFFTAYTPYQPEVSQGTLQAIYEHQSYVCRLTGMDVANASMYDGATAMVEACLLAAHFTGRRRVVISGGVHPEWIETLRTYAAAGLLDPVVLPVEHGRTRFDVAEPLLEDAACLVVADPGFLGTLEDLRAASALCVKAEALFVVTTDLSLMGVLEPPSAFGADVVVGEGQPLGNAMSFGGPGFGFFAARYQYLRRMPGRIVGRTVDAEGARGFVLTMQTREQHIRREKATSNICSNHALNALAATVHLAMLGPQGLAETGRAAVAKAHYLRDALLATGRFSAPWDAPFAREFVLRFQGDVAAMQAAALEGGYLAGVSLARFPGLEEIVGMPVGDLVLFAATEKRTRAQIDEFVKVVTAL